jgi:hypothetical protein
MPLLCRQQALRVRGSTPLEVAFIADRLRKRRS